MNQPCNIRTLVWRFQPHWRGIGALSPAAKFQFQPSVSVSGFSLLKRAGFGQRSFASVKACLLGILRTAKPDNRHSGSRASDCPESITTGCCAKAIAQRDLQGGRTRRVTIAHVNELPLAEAKERARKLLVD